ncbi:LOW QUALITY PROTEIN: arsenite methyltransferase [Rhynchonycteris naso]
MNSNSPFPIGKTKDSQDEVGPSRTRVQGGTAGVWGWKLCGEGNWQRLDVALEAHRAEDCLPCDGASGLGCSHSLELAAGSLCPWPLGQTYYRQVLKRSDLQTNACVTVSRQVPKHMWKALQNVHEEVALSLDLGSESGRGCYALSAEKGHVTGIDTTVQVEVAKNYIDYHLEKGFQTPQAFIHGYTEKLGEAGIKNQSYDIVM